jgi:hypothetical protein
VRAFTPRAARNDSRIGGYAASSHVPVPRRVQKWLSRHSAAFTLSKYIHLLGDELGEPLAIDTKLAGATAGATSVTELIQGAGAPVDADSTQGAEFAMEHKPAQAARVGS